MLVLSKKSVLLFVVIALAVLALALTALHAVNPPLWQHFADGFVPNVWNHY